MPELVFLVDEQEHVACPMTRGKPAAISSFRDHVKLQLLISLALLILLLCLLLLGPSSCSFTLSIGLSALAFLSISSRSCSPPFFNRRIQEPSHQVHAPTLGQGFAQCTAMFCSTVLRKLPDSTKRSALSLSRLPIIQPASSSIISRVTETARVHVIIAPFRSAGRPPAQTRTAPRTTPLPALHYSKTPACSTCSRGPPRADHIDLVAPSCRRRDSAPVVHARLRGVRRRRFVCVPHFSTGTLENSVFNERYPDSCAYVPS